MAVETKFGANTTEFSRGIQRMQAEVKGLSGRLSGSIGGGIKGMVGGLLAGFSLGAIKGIFDELDRLNDLGKTLGETPEDMQRMAQAAKLGGADVEKLATAFVKTAQAVREYRAGLKGVGEEGQDGKKLSRAMNQLGINSGEFVKSGVSEQMFMVARGMEAMSDPAAANAAAIDLLGAKYKDLLPVLQEGEAGLKKAMGAAAIVSNEDVAKIAEFNDQVDILGMNLKALGASGGLKLLGFGQMIAGAFLTVGGSIKKLDGLFSDEINESADHWLAAADKLSGESAKNLFGNGPVGLFAEEKPDKEAAAAAEVAAKLAGQRKEVEEKITELRKKANLDAMSAQEKVTALLNEYTKAMSENDFETAIKAYEELMKAERDMVKEKKKAEDDIAKEKADAIQSLADLEKETSRERLSVEEQIAALRKEAIEQAAAGNYKEAAAAGKELTTLIGRQIDKAKDSQEKLAGSGGVIADSLRKVGLGGVAVSASINKSILQVNQDSLTELRAIKEKIGKTDSTPLIK